MAGGRDDARRIWLIRYQAYKEATAIYLAERPTIPIFHQVWVFAASAKLQGFTPYVDDIVRPVGLSLAK